MFKNLISGENLNTWIKNSKEECQSSYPLPKAMYGDSPQKKPVAVDIGANIGGFCALHSNKFDKIYAFEPFYSNSRVITSILNSLKIKNVTVLKHAVHAESGKILTLKAPNYECSGDIVCVDDDTHQDYKNIGQKCTTISLKDIFSMFFLDKIDYLKMDCEGAEYDILENFNDYDKIDIMCLEIHGFKALERKKQLVRKLIKSYNLFFPAHYSHKNGDKDHGWVELKDANLKDQTPETIDMCYEKVSNLLCIHRVNSDISLFDDEIFLDKLLERKNIKMGAIDAT
jgi:FkbM family methyltransferase